MPYRGGRLKRGIMPHLIVEYSSNIEADIKIEELLGKLRDTAAGGGVFPLPGIRVRAARRDQYLIADGDPGHAFVHVSARIGVGRSEATRRAEAERLFEALCAHLAPSYQKRGLAISFEMVEIDPVGSLKMNNLHDRLRQ